MISAHAAPRPSRENPFLSDAGWSVRDIANQLGHSPPTIRSYLDGRRTPGVRAPRPRLLTDPLADYCRQRLSEDQHLRPSTLFNEVLELGFSGSRATFYRELAQRQLSPPDHRRSPAQPNLADTGRPVVHPTKHAWVLPRPIALVTGETLISYLTRLAHANYLTVAEVLAVLPSWFFTKINNRDDRAQHHMLAHTTAEALRALAHLNSTTPISLARALPAFGATDAHRPVRATTACHRCIDRRGIHQPVPVHLPIHDKVCTRHGIWRAHANEPNLDITTCPEIITAQHRANRLLRRYTPQQLTLAHQIAVRDVPAWPASPAALPHHWRHRLLMLQTTNHHRSIPTEHDSYTHAAIYPEAVTLAVDIVNSGRIRTIEQDSLAQPRDPQPASGPNRGPNLPVKIPHPRSERSR